MIRPSAAVAAVALLLALLLRPVAAPAAELAALLPDRLRSVVAVEFSIQTETERQPVVAYGSVVDAAGLVILPGSAIQAGQPIDQLKDFKVYRAQSDTSAAATYLGQDALTGFHFVRIAEGARDGLQPLTAYPVAAEPDLGEELWSLGLRGKDEDFQPYLLSARVALLARLPNRTALLAHDIGAPGLPVFNRAGALVGLMQNAFGQNYLLFSQRQSATPIVLVNVEESSVVLLAREFLPHLDRVPATATGRPVTWFGAYGLQPVDPDVAKLLHLERQAGVVLSDILPGSPAALAGLQDRDIVLAVAGQPLPRLKPDRVVLGYLGQEILKRRAGDALALTVLRGTEKLDVTVTLGEEPKMAREAERRYFERLGFTAREFLAADGIMHRATAGEQGGAVVNFIKPSSPSATGGLRPDDWIREIDGVEVPTYAAAIARLATIEADPARREFVLLTRRGGETQVLRVKLN